MAYYTPGGAIHFEHQDWLGTERARTTYNGGTEGTFTSLPWGDGASATGADTDANHFATLDHDAETDTEQAQWRQYESAQGRWLSPDPYSGSYDPSNPQSFNRYAYAMNSPMSNVDPSGLTSFTATVGTDCLVTTTYEATYSYILDFTKDLVSPFISNIRITDVQTSCSPIYANININTSSGTNNAPNNGECDNACQLAHAFTKTGVYSLKNPCFIGGFYAASAGGAVAAGDTLAAGEIGEAGTAIRTAAQASKTLQAVDRAKWWLGIAGLYEVATGK